DVVIQPDIREKAHNFDVKGREDTMKSGIDAANAKLSDFQFAIDEKIAEQNMSTEGLSAKTQ
ncbi:patatin-like phospholipase family protein, partial [Acinetobacter calcoaceticus]